ncbi:MAG: hypothetical protein IPG04_17890 [Polyangiaceae bacterium]|nr:hypothetical protein [Polyangiaceae bacterium]
MPITDLQKSAIARTLVGAERGTAFLVTKDLLLTALHCVARLVPGRPEGFEKLGPDILVRFGDPKGQPCDAGKATLIAANVEDDVALLLCAPPPDVQPLPLGQTSAWARPLEWRHSASRRCRAAWRAIAGVCGDRRSTARSPRSGPSSS